MHNQEIKIRINSLLKEQLLKYCADNNITYSELVRELIKDKLKLDISVEKFYKIEVKSHEYF